MDRELLLETVRAVENVWTIEKNARAQFPNGLTCALLDELQGMFREQSLAAVKASAPRAVREFERVPVRSTEKLLGPNSGGGAGIRKVSVNGEPVDPWGMKEWRRAILTTAVQKGGNVTHEDLREVYLREAPSSISYGRSRVYGSLNYMIGLEKPLIKKQGDQYHLTALGKHYHDTHFGKGEAPDRNVPESQEVREEAVPSARKGGLIESLGPLAEAMVLFAMKNQNYLDVSLFRAHYKKQTDKNVANKILSAILHSRLFKMVDRGTYDLTSIGLAEGEARQPKAMAASA